MHPAAYFLVQRLLHLHAIYVAPLDGPVQAYTAIFGACKARTARQFAQGVHHLWADLHGEE